MAAATGLAGRWDHPDSSPLVDLRVAAAERAPDLLVTRLSEPPASVRLGGALPVSDTARNAGVARSKPSLIRYYLSRGRGLDDRARGLTGARALTALNPNKALPGSTTLTVPKATPTGRYHLIACADDLKAIEESSEANNCRASRRKISVRKPAASPPPLAPPRLADAPAAATRATKALFRFSSSQRGLTFRCQLDGGAFGSCRSPRSYPGPLSEGPHVFAVHARDRRGRKSPVAPYGWVVDRTPPSAPTLGSRPPALTSSKSADVTFTGGERGLSFRCGLDGGDPRPCQSPHRLSDLADGSHTLAVRAVDAAGNESASAQATWRVDTSAPQTRIDGHPAADTSATSARFAFSADEPEASFRCRLDGADFGACASPHDLVGLEEGEHTFEVRARDPAGNEGGAASFEWRIDTTAPTAPTITSRPPELTRARGAELEFTGAEPGVAFRCRLDGGELTPCQSPHKLSDLADGDHSFEVRAVDRAGNDSAPAEARWRVDATPPPKPEIAAHPDSETRERTARFTFSSAEAGASFRCRLDDGEPVDCQSPKELSDLADGQHTFEVRARDAIGNESEGASFSWKVDPAAPLQLDPTPVDPTVATTVVDSTKFLYTGEDAVQTGVDPGAIEEQRAAVLRGRVTARSGEPLSSVEVTVLDHPELGRTETRADGQFDLAANGGGPLTVEYRKPGFLPVQRQVEVPWQDYAPVDDAVMIEADDRVTTIEAGSTADFQVARGSETSDSDGKRQNTLLFPKGTTAEMRLPDGSRRPLGDLHVRATEYTVGNTGPEAMPAALPPTSGYTYAAELSVDEAMQAGATEVRFSEPVFNYVENFRDFPVGTPIPTGYYDRERGQWVASKDGRVVKVVDESGGRAELDTDGDGEGDAPDKLAALGVTDPERERLAALYEPGQSLWRVPLEHFSPVDYNWPFGPPDDAEPPNQPDPKADPRPDCQSQQQGSVIGCEGQTLGESLDVAGSPFGLRYQSERTPGRGAARQLRIPLTGPRVPASVRGVELEVSVAGQRFKRSFSAGPSQAYTFIWDGKDAYGRAVQGSQPVTTRVGYVYGVVYKRSRADQVRSFALFGGGPISFGSAGSRTTVTSWQVWKGRLGAWDARGQGLGGWSLDAHHAYDPAPRTLHTGNGQRRSADELDLKVIDTYAGNGTVGYGGEGGPAKAAALHNPRGIAAGPDGSLYIADGYNYRIRRVRPDGSIETVAGNGVTADPPPGETPRPATAVRLNHPRGVAVAPDQSVYITHDNGIVSRVRPDGKIVKFAGTQAGFGGDGGPANQAKLHSPEGIAAAPDGSVYVADSHNHRIRRIGPDGIITTVAGGGEWSPGLGDGGGASEAHLTYPWDVAVAPDGSLLIADSFRQRVRKVGPDGIITTVAGSERGLGGDGTQATEQRFEHYVTAVDAGPDGSIYVGVWGGSVRRVRPDGVMTRLTQSGGTPTGDRGPARRATVGAVSSVALGPDGSLFVSESSDFFGGAANRVRRINTTLPGLGVSNISIASEDGGELYVFDPAGRHLRTVDALTNTVRYRFSYDGAGRLDKVEDADGNATKIEHDGEGKPTAIVAPGGQRTTLETGADGYLSRVSDPADQVTKLDYGSGGLLSSRTDAKGGVHRFSYDGDGRLTKDEDPAEGSKTLSRSDTADGYKVAVRTALGRTSTYEVEHLPTGDVRRRVTDPSGGRTEALIGRDGRTSVSAPDGTSLSQELGPDPRFGMQAPVVSKQVRKTPGGLTQTTTGERTAARGASGELKELTERGSVNGRTGTQTYDAAARTLTQTSPAGRKSVTTLDAKGRAIRVEPAPGVEAVTYAYDERGRLKEQRQGGQATSYAYDSQDRLASVSDASGKKVEYGYDRADRVTELKLPSGKTYGFAYDRNGNRTEVRMPSGAVHRMEHTPVDDERSYTPPGGDGLTQDYDRDRAPTRTSLPGGRTIERSYDEGARAKGSKYDEASVALEYADATGRAKSMTTTPAGDGSAQKSGFSYDGGLLTSMTSSGSADGRFDHSYDNNLFRTGSKLTSGSETMETPLEHDADGLLTKIGPFSIARGGPAGAPSELGDGTLKAAYTHDSLGRLAKRTHAVAGEEDYKLELTQDSAGRITRKQETLAGEEHTYDYAFDPDGQLTRVDRDGQAAERYVYDDNGNRISRQLGEQPAESADYDRRDRLSRRGSTSYEFDEAGFLTRRGEDAFRYSARGELLEAKVGERTVTYAYDGMGRRVARREGERRTAYLYGSPDEPFQVTATKDQTGALTTLHYDEQGLLIALERVGQRYYVATDQVGTPRLVTTAEGQVVKRLDWDSFGVLAHDSDPAFELPLGFAGGLYDQLTGLTRFGFRDYDPAAGRWTARDPIRFDSSDINLYRYAGNDPITLIDRDGLTPFRPGPNHIDTPFRPGPNHIDLPKAGSPGYLEALKKAAENSLRYPTTDPGHFQKYLESVKAAARRGCTGAIEVVKPILERGKNLGRGIRIIRLPAAFDFIVIPQYFWEEMQEMQRRRGGGLGDMPPLA